MINRLLGKKQYAKPVLVLETFVPQEYCSGCWYAESSDFMTGNLYCDTKQSHREFLFYDSWDYGWYDDGEKITLPSTSRLPASGSLKDSDLTTVNNANSDPGKYYTDKHDVALSRYDQYTSTSQIGQDDAHKFYIYTDGTTVYYLKSFHSAGNHS